MRKLRKIQTVSTSTASNCRNVTKKPSGKLEKDAIMVPGINNIVFVKVNNATLECVDVAILVKRGFVDFHL